MYQCIYGFFKEIEDAIDNEREIYSRSTIMEAYALIAFHSKVFAHIFKLPANIHKLLWSFQLKVPIIHIIGNVTWFISEFLDKYLFLKEAKISPQREAVVSTRKQILKQLDDSFSDSIKDLYAKSCLWMASIETELLDGRVKNLKPVIEKWSRLLIHGIRLADLIRLVVLNNIFLHIKLSIPFQKSHIRSIAMCLELLKSIQSTYSRQKEFIFEARKFVVSSSQRTIYDYLSRIEKEIPTLLKAKRKDSAHLQAVLTAIDVVIRQLDSPFSKQRYAVMRTALDIALSDGLLSKENREDIVFHAWKFETLQALEENIEQSCSTDFVCFLCDMFPTMFGDIMQNPEQAPRLYYLLHAFQDGSRILGTAQHMLTESSLSELYKNIVKKELKQNFIDQIARTIENDLRLHFHSVELNQENLTDTSTLQFTYILNLKPLCLWDEVIDIKERISHYLDVTFYNLATISLHKWKTYAEMRALARQKYGLELNEVYLPSHAHFSQGLDILEIMRNIHVFVSRYNYNINSQVFVQRAIDQKHLNTIGIEHISNSIRTHGSGIMSTTVNFAYQFLKKKIHIFSEFLFDDYILSRLIRDSRFFFEKKAELKNEYPYERAEKFISEIRSLGVSQKGMSYLDHFRQLITEIGNTLGYVRMVRSGGLNAISNSIKFIPDLEHSIKFEELVVKENLSLPSVDAAKNLDSHLSFLTDQFAEGADYFKILVRVMSQVLSQSQQSSHLKNFYAIIPSVTITFVEKMINQKERLGKRSGAEVSFTDDGFAIGLAFILRTLSQNDDFDTLHWFDGVKSYVQRKRSQLTNPSSGNDSESIAISTKRLDALLKEFELLFYSFSGARIFFRDSDPVAVLPTQQSEHSTSSSDQTQSIDEGN